MSIKIKRYTKANRINPNEVEDSSKEIKIRAIKSKKQKIDFEFLKKIIIDNEKY